MTGSRPPIGRLSPDNWASHGAGRHWLRGHTPHFLHEKCAVSTESQLLKIVRRPEQSCATPPKRHQLKIVKAVIWMESGRFPSFENIWTYSNLSLFHQPSLPLPQAGLPSHGCDTAVGVCSTDAIQLGALELLLKATGRDLIPLAFGQVWRVGF